MTPTDIFAAISACQYMYERTGDSRWLFELAALRRRGLVGFVIRAPLPTPTPQRVT